MNEKNVHSGHRRRMREKYLNQGIEVFTEHEVMELLLFYAIPMKNTNPLAHRLLEHFGSFSAVFDASPASLTEFGLTENAVTLIKLIPDLSRMYKVDKSENPNKALNVFDLCSYFEPRFHGVQEEYFRLLLLDKKCKEVFSGVITKGSINFTDVPIRRVVALALQYNAAFAAVAHNHPSGLALPSEADLKVTESLFTALRLVNVRLVDHIIVADDDSISMALSGMGIFGKDIDTDGI